MAKIGGWWLSKQRLEDDESLLDKYPTNYFHGDTRPLGGRLYVTDRRLVFLPHFIDSLLGGSTTNLWFTEIEAVSSEAEFLTEDETDDRRLPIRLRIESTDGSVHFFVVKNVERSADTINEAIDDTLWDDDHTN